MDARVLTLDALTREQQRMFAKGEGLGFRFEQDLNSDGVPELLLLGDYRAGPVHSTFVLIASRGPDTWVATIALPISE